MSASWTRLAGRRILAVRGRGSSTPQKACSLHCGAAVFNQAFVEIVQTAKAHNVSTLSLADALVALAQNQASQNEQDAAFGAPRAAWGHLLDSAPSRGVRSAREDDSVAGA